MRLISAVSGVQIPAPPPPKYLISFRWAPQKIVSKSSVNFLTALDAQTRQAIITTRSQPSTISQPSDPCPSVSIQFGLQARAQNLGNFPEASGRWFVDFMLRNGRRSAVQPDFSLIVPPPSWENHDLFLAARWHQRILSDGQSKRELCK
jgi:hypothetical protein